MPKSTTSTPGGQLALRAAAARPRRRSRRRRGRRCRCRRPGSAAPRPAPARRRAARPRRARRRSGGPIWRAAPRSRPGSSSSVTASWTAPSIVLDDLLDDRGPARERDVEDVAAASAGAAARGCRGAARRRRRRTASRRRAARAASQLERVIGRREPELADRAVQPHQLLRRERLACAPGSRARAGRPPASRAFSSSVRARMLRISSWSISPPSNRSPGLSGAICG